MSIVLFIAGILHFTLSPNLIGPGLLWLTLTGTLMLCAILLFLRFLKLKYDFSTFDLIYFSFLIAISIFLLLALILWSLVMMNLN